MKMLTRLGPWLLCLAGATAAQAQAQEGGLGLSAGLKVWSTQWTTFSYAPAPNTTITQVPAKDQVVIVPAFSVRYRNFVGSVSGFSDTDFDFQTGGSGTRSEFDASVGYYVTPSVAVVLGFKRMRQKGDASVYEPKGPFIGLSATAPLGSDLSLYGTIAMGTTKSNATGIVFDGEYRLTEVGVAYSIPTSTFVRAISFTAGYRMQVLNSKEALAGQDARDLTQGFALGVVASF